MMKKDRIMRDDVNLWYINDSVCGRVCVYVCVTQSAQHKYMTIISVDTMNLIHNPIQFHFFLKRTNCEFTFTALDIIDD